MLKHLILLTLIVVVHGDANNDDGKIVGGKEVVEGGRPYQVSLRLTDITGTTYLCGGSILSARWILTAAHCLRAIIRIEVRAGSLNLGSGGITATTNRYRAHPLYNPITNDFDVGVIDLRSDVLPLNNSTIKAVNLVDESDDPEGGTPVVVSGWGTTMEGGEISKTLMEVEVLVVNDTECRESYPQLTERMLCAGVKEGGKDSCQGDSGGPLVLSSDNTQVGIVSYGIGCARPDVPGVYSDVAALRGWIGSNTGL